MPTCFRPWEQNPGCGSCSFFFQRIPTAWLSARSATSWKSQARARLLQFRGILRCRLRDLPQNVLRTRLSLHWIIGYFYFQPCPSFCHFTNQIPRLRRPVGFRSPSPACSSPEKTDTSWFRKKPGRAMHTHSWRWHQPYDILTEHVSSIER
jgi:hypothetical protein